MLPSYGINLIIPINNKQAYGLTELIRLFYARDTFILRVSINLCHNEYKIPFFAATVFKHTLKVRSVVVRARHGSVDIGIENKNIILLSVFLANAQLSFDRVLRLVIARISILNRYSLMR